MLCVSKLHAKFVTFAKIWENIRANGLRAFVEIKAKLEIKSAWGVC